MRVLFGARRIIFSQQVMCLQKPVKSAWNFRVRRQGRVREEPVRAIDRDKKKQSWYPIVKYSLPTLIREILEKTSHCMMVHWWQWVWNLLQPHWCLPHDPFLFRCLLPFLLSCSWQPIICVCVCVCVCVYPFVLFLLVTASSLTTHHAADQRVVFSIVISSQLNSSLLVSDDGKKIFPKHTPKKGFNAKFQKALFLSLQPTKLLLQISLPAAHLQLPSSNR